MAGMTALLRISLLAGAMLVAGCDMLGIESAQAQAERRDADGKAVGGACRHAGRAIEDCYALNRKADRAAMFAGWREMNDYMRTRSTPWPRSTPPPSPARRPRPKPPKCRPVMAPPRAPNAARAAPDGAGAVARATAAAGPQRLAVMSARWAARPDRRERRERRDHRYGGGVTGRKVFGWKKTSFLSFFASRA